MTTFRFLLCKKCGYPKWHFGITTVTCSCGGDDVVMAEAKDSKETE